MAAVPPAPPPAAGGPAGPPAPAPNLAQVLAFQGNRLPIPQDAIAALFVLFTAWHHARPIERNCSLPSDRSAQDLAKERWPELKLVLDQHNIVHDQAKLQFRWWKKGQGLLPLDTGVLGATAEEQAASTRLRAAVAGRLVQQVFDDYLLVDSGLCKASPYMRQVVVFCRKSEHMVALMVSRVEKLTKLLIYHSSQSAKSATRKEGDFNEARRRTGNPGAIPPAPPTWGDTFNADLEKRILDDADSSARDALRAAGRHKGDVVADDLLYSDLNALRDHVERALHQHWKDALCQEEDFGSIVVAAAKQSLASAPGGC